MKKKMIFLLSTLMLSGFTACGNVTSKENSTAKLNYSAITKVALEAGNFTIYDYGKIKLHAYATEDALDDEAFIIEGPDTLVGIELPSFTKNLDAWKNYISTLNKPMKDIFLSNHVTGASYIKGMTVYGTQGTKEAVTKGATFATTQGLHKIFGDDFHGGNEMAQINKIIPTGTITAGGIEFKVIDRGDAYDLEIPSLNIIYTHMLGKNVHSIMTNTAHMDSMLTILKEYQDSGYDMILSAHSAPEGQDAVTEKIAYIIKAKELAEKYTTGKEFISAMKNAFPNYSGENYLEMTAGFLYQ